MQAIADAAGDGERVVSAWAHAAPAWLVDLLLRRVDVMALVCDLRDEWLGLGLLGPADDGADFHGAAFRMVRRVFRSGAGAGRRALALVSMGPGRLAAGMARTS